MGSADGQTDGLKDEYHFRKCAKKLHLCMSHCVIASPKAILILCATLNTASLKAKSKLFLFPDLDVEMLKNRRWREQICFFISSGRRPTLTCKKSAIAFKKIASSTRIVNLHKKFHPLKTRTSFQ